MEKLNYQSQVVFSTLSGKPGTQVAIEVRLDQVIGELSQVWVTVPGYSLDLNLTKSSEQPHFFSGSTMVPWEAYAGTYPVMVYGQDPAGNMGPVTYQTFTVL